MDLPSNSKHSVEACKKSHPLTFCADRDDKYCFNGITKTGTGNDHMATPNPTGMMYYC